MTRFHTLVPLRWADLDAFRHVNHARAVTLLEQARVELVFHEGAGAGAGGWSDGLLVAALEIEYRAQIPYRGQSLRVSMWVEDVRAARFTIQYEMRVGPGEGDPVAVTARTRMVPFDLVGNHPRRLAPDERTFLARWSDVPDPPAVAPVPEAPNPGAPSPGAPSPGAPAPADRVTGRSAHAAGGPAPGGASR